MDDLPGPNGTAPRRPSAEALENAAVQPLDLAKVQEMAWGGQVPIKLVLADDEVASVAPPPPEYVLAPRMAYLPALVQDTIARLRESAIVVGNEKNSTWFECSGFALKWQLPVGVLVDVLSVQELNKLPFTIIVHFRNPPKFLLRGAVDELTAKWEYFNCLKQSACLRFGSAEVVITGLSQQQQNTMWDAVVNGRYADFAECNKNIHGIECEKLSRRWNIRIVFAVEENANDSASHKMSTMAAILRALKSRAAIVDGATGNSNTMQIEEDRGPQNEYPPTILQYLVSLGFPRDSIWEEDVMIHGVHIPLDTPLPSICEVLSHADNCLYIVLSPRLRTQWRP